MIFDDVQELAELMESPPTGIKVELADESDVYKWKVFMKGPEDTPYQVHFPPCSFLSYDMK